MFKFVTWAIVSLACGLGINYYNTVERPDHNMQSALSQFENDDSVIRTYREKTFVENSVTPIAALGWMAFTGLCYWGDVRRFAAWTISDSKAGEV